jgi:hypothetical protein
MTKLDKTGKEVSLPTVSIPQEYHVSEQQYIAPPIQGFKGDVDTRHQYSEAEMTSISHDIRNATPKGATLKSGPNKGFVA